MATHEFGIIENINEKKNYNDYEPEKYNSIYVDDELIEPLLAKMKILNTYYHSFNRPEFGLAYYGITLIPPESLESFQELLLNEKVQFENGDLDKLIQIVTLAIKREKHMIHFGI